MKNWKERNGKLKWRIEWQVQWDSAEEKIRKVRKNQRLDLSTLKNINSGKYFGRAMIQLDSCGYKNADSESNSAPDEGQYFCCFIHNLRDCKISQRLVLSEPCVLSPASCRHLCHFCFSIAKKCRRWKCGETRIIYVTRARAASTNIKSRFLLLLLHLFYAAIHNEKKEDCTNMIK